MNAALILMSSVMMTGADAAPAAPKPIPLAAPASPYAAAPAVNAAPAHGPAVVAAPGNCGGCATACDSCDSGKGGLLSRFRGLFSKKDDCCEPCAKPAPACHSHIQHAKPCKPEPACKPAPVACKPEPACKPAATCGGCATACDTCDSKGGIFSRLKARFGKKDCDACDPCHGAVAPHGAVVPSKEMIVPKEAPKKMPEKVGLPTPVEITPTATPVKPIIEVGGPGNPF